MNIKKDIVEKIPFDPGIYMMKDETGTVIYVGKAKSLRKRVRQYFNKTNKTKRIQNMVSKICNIEYIVTSNELEALALECNYIKEFMPKYNVMLKDDKTYPYIKVTTKDEYPSVYITRTRVEDGSKYFGPYTDVNAIRETLITLREIFPLKRCKYNLNKKCNAKVGPCLYYHIGRCLGPCINEINKKEYASMINQLTLFLDGNIAMVKEHIEKQIEVCINKLEFEKANELKLRMEKMDKLKDKQKVSNINEVSTDIWGYVFATDKLYIQIFKIRNSKLLKHDKLSTENIEKKDFEKEFLNIVSQYYTVNKSDIPNKIYFSLNENKVVEEIEILTNYVSSIKNSKVQILIPKKGDKLKLVNMIENNIESNIKEKDKNPLDDLRLLLKIEGELQSVESYDISNLKDTYIVGAGICFENGEFNKSKYRKYKINSTLTQNDVLSMSEVITRRIKHIETMPLPDLICIDGGNNQVNAVKEVLKKQEVDIPVIGMIKDDKHRTRGIIDLNGNEIDLRNEQSKRLLNFITKLQDETHRFVITYHRNLRDKIK